ncbi:helix-turn-helix domain-containing protein [Hymenobacter sp. BT683]|uniref:Helix-turn-helix domain-containing protein n=1 Tax=Hymenobacter jeongseonensis TaxID=2791027 RepID=A0ABS0II38_9BACT|nr:helix-turn-helix domain-containing protein [Hymenobacter jeongseonensis]
MVERIRKLLESRQLTPTQFADAIGIARPIVSHILSGRNKPSLEVVQRILAAMPELSMPWLLNGTGPMLASAIPSASPELRPAPSPVTPPVLPVEQKLQQQVLVPVDAPTMREVPATATRARRTPNITSIEGGTPPPISKTAPKRFALPKIVAPQAMVRENAPLTPVLPNPEAAIPPSERTAAPQPAAASTAEASFSPSTDTNPTAAALFAGADKPIRRIVIFYRDGSFADYQPE